MQFVEIKTIEQLDWIIEEINFANYAYIALDCETTGLDYFRDHILSFTFTPAGSEIAYFAPGDFKAALSKCQVPVVLHNFKFDFHMFFRAGIDLRNLGLRYDTIILDHLLDENNPHGLDDIVQRRYGDTYKEVFWNTYKTFEEAPRPAQIEYACKDVLYTDRICRDTLTDLTKDGIPASLITHVNNLALTLYDTEINGVRVDLPYVAGLAESLSAKINDLKTKLYSRVELECQMVENELFEKELEKRKTPKGKLSVKRPRFSFDSPAQLGALLYDHLSLPIQLNKQRNRTTDDEALERLESYHPVVSAIREYRAYQKVFTSFIEGTLEKVRDSKIYPTFNACGTVTGRISSSNPNLQQLPSSGGVRGIYVPKEGYVFISRDYSQLEIVIAAHFSQDKNLFRIVLEGASQHDITAQGLGIDRAKAKMINFAMLYGAGVSKIKSILGCNDAEAQEALNKYWNTYPGLKSFISECHLRVDRGLPMITPFGRRRHFPKKFQSHWEKERAKRQAANSVIQSTGADCTNESFYTIDKVLRRQGTGRALLLVHDEVIIEVRKDRAEEADERLGQIMSSIGVKVQLTLPLKTSSSGPMVRWED